MTQTYLYTVPVEPIPLAKVTDNNDQKVWNTYKQDRFYYVQSIKNQHDLYFEGASFEQGATKRRQFVGGAISLEATFYMKSTPAHEPGKIHSKNPPIFSLFNFLDHALQGVVYKKDCTISSVNIKKIYDENPRTEIKIERL